MSALLRKHIPDCFSWEHWRGSYDEIIPYLENGFGSALIEFESNIKNEELKSELKKLVEYLCNPFPEKRGHPKNIQMGSNNYCMERFVSNFDVLKRKVELQIKYA